MQALRRFATAAAVAALCVKQGAAQSPDGTYTDPKSGITFNTYKYEGAVDPAVNPSGAITFGMVLPEDAGTKDANEYIGVLRCASVDASGGWCGLSHGESGQMTQALLLMAWPHNGEVLTSFRFVGGYSLPPEYKGDAKLTQISSTVNSTGFEVVYRCQNCFSWGSGSQASTLKVHTSSGNLILGRAAAAKGPTNAECPSKITFGFHDLAYGQYGAQVSDLTNANYAAWTALATKTPTTGCAPASSSSAMPTKSSMTPTSTTSAPTSSPTMNPPANCPSLPAGKAFDYIIVGAGAGGIPIADRLSEAGASVLLIEKGPPSSGRYNGQMKPGWLQGTNLTRFDVPGLCNEIWHNSTGVACTDTDQMAGCVLGGGVAVNAGLWWKAPAKDWDENFPAGWKARDTAGAVQKAFQRIPGTWVPSMDGKLYRQEGFNVLSQALNSSGAWKEVDANTVPNEKNRTYSHSTFMFSGGERGGPMATYLWTASQRKTFTLIMNAPARRVVRTGGHATGVELECGAVVPLTANTGRVIVSAGTFGSAKFLMRSGIGPADQLEVVKGTTDGPTMIDSKDWIDLPVGYNLNDHVNTDTIVDHPDVVFYDFYEAYETPIPSDKDKYLSNRTGILAQAAPNIGPLMWEEVTSSDGKVRQLQWTARVEGTYNTSMTISLYLGRGSTSRGRMTIQPDLGTFVSTPPYLRDNNDKEAVIKGIDNLRATLKLKGLRFLVPAENQTTEAYVNSLLPTPGQRRANHWIGTAKLGTDDGRNNGTAVVDTNTKVYGTDNIFVVDASIFPGMVTGNPSAMIVSASEHAAARIRALRAPSLGRNLSQCGGRKWNGSFSCARGLTCQYVNRDLSICAAPGTALQSIRPEDVIVEE